MKKSPLISAFSLIFLILCVTVTASFSGCNRAGSGKETADYFTFVALENKTYEVQANKAVTLSQKIEIPSKYKGKSVTRIGDYAFANCRNITEITIPETVKSIGEHAFWKCSGLTKIVIPDEVKTIGNHAFLDCSGLKSITLPENLTDISKYSFRGCVSLKKITIPEKVKNIGEGAFSGCGSLTEISIPESVGSIGEGAFNECGNLAGVYISSVEKWCDIEFITASSNPLTTAHNLYLNGKLVTDLIIPEGIEYLDNYSFYGCGCIKSAVIPESALSIGESEFCGCENLTEITVPENVEFIGEKAFGSCVNLKKISITGGALLIDQNAFEDCGSLAGVYIDDIEKWCCIEFSSVSANPLTTAHNLYLNGELVTDLVIPDGISNLHNCSFAGCSSIKNVTIPESVNRINSLLFSDCTGITSIQVYGNEVDIDYEKFSACENLKYNEYENAFYLGNESNPYLYLVKVNDNLEKTAVINENTAVICRQAFSGCGDLKSVTIPESVRSIKLNAFFGCADLEEITFTGTVKQWENIVKGGGWNQATGKYTVKCSDGELEKVESYIESEEYEYEFEYDYEYEYDN